MTTKGDLFITAKRFVFEIGCRRDFERYTRVKSAAMRAAGSVGLYERRNLTALRRFVSPGDLVVDGGANFGVYTARLQELVGPRGSVIAVEPLPFVMDRLTERYGAFPNVELVQKALSDRVDESVEISVPYLVPGLLEPALASLGGTALDSKRFRVSVTTLDSLLDQRRRVSFIKLDLEGHELPALSGGRGALMRDRPIVQFEVNDTPQELGQLRRVRGFS